MEERKNEFGTSVFGGYKKSSVDDYVGQLLANTIELEMQLSHTKEELEQNQSRISEEEKAREQLEKRCKKQEEVIARLKEELHAFEDKMQEVDALCREQKDKLEIYESKAKRYRMTIKKLQDNLDKLRLPERSALQKGRASIEKLEKVVRERIVRS